MYRHRVVSVRLCRDGEVPDKEKCARVIRKGLPLCGKI